MAQNVGHRPISRATARLIANKVCQALELPPVKVRYEGWRREALGTYHPNSHVVRLYGNRGQAVSVLLHEIAHHLTYEKDSRWGMYPEMHGSEFQRRHSEVVDLYLSQSDLQDISPKKFDSNVLTDIVSVVGVVALIGLLMFIEAKRQA